MNSLKRLLYKLYVLAFLYGFVFWYAIEKLFEIQIGLTAQEIIVIGIILHVAIILFEIPSSLVADRVSRKHTLILANVIFAFSSVILGLSNSFWTYTGAVIIWSLSEALNSGVIEAFTYDALATIGYKSHYRRVISYMEGIKLISLGVVGVVAGVIGQHLGLAVNFFISAVPPFIAIGVLLTMSEPPISRTSEQGLTWIRHLTEGIKILIRPTIVWSAVGLLLILGLLTLWYEYYQLIAIDVLLPKNLFGLATGFLTVGLLIGALWAGKLQPSKRLFVLLWLLLFVVNSLIIVAGNYYVALIIMLIASIAIHALNLYIKTYVQDHIPSSQRATVLSLLTSWGRVCFFVFAAILLTAMRLVNVKTAMAIAAIPLLMYGLITVKRQFKDYLSEP